MRLYPPEKPRYTKSEAEKRVWSMLAKVRHDGWICLHSLAMRTRKGSDGEGDFVLIDPARGFLVIEVKGARVELKSGEWTQAGRPLTPPPRVQALGFAHKLGKELRAAGLGDVPFGAAVILPDCEFSDGPESGDLRGVVLGKRELHYLGEALGPLMDRALPPGRKPPENTGWIDHLHKLWGERWVPTVSLSDRIGDALQRVALDDAQLALLESAEDNQRAMVRGGAGTGKTLVATELCRRRAAKGQSTLYVCFTDALAVAVQKQFGTDNPKLRAASIRLLALEFLKARGTEVPKDPNKKFWDTVSLEAALNALPQDKPDLLVVDEGQDFEPHDWLLALQMSPRGLWVFMDDRQAFWKDRTLPPGVAAEVPTTLKLRKSYRCPESLAAFAETYVDPEAVPTQASPEQLKVLTVDKAEVLPQVEREVRALLAAGARPEHIAIISLAGMQRSELFNLKEFAGTKLCHAVDDEAGKHLVVETFLRFKGLERPFVIVTELPESGASEYATRMHIALTRATVQAIVVVEREAAKIDPRLTPPATAA